MGKEGTQPELADWLLFSILASPHALYAIVWLFPGSWRAVFGRSSLNAFAATASALKVLQLSVVLLWWFAYDWAIPSLKSTPLLHLLVGAGLVGAGQTLNVSMYNAIGKKGVYYGTKLGYNVPWCHGFPFNYVGHPQYVGSVLTIWGIVALVYAQGPSTLPIIAAYWTGLYVVTGLIEQYL